VYKRKDFDISHNGLPIFEFNSCSLFNGNQQPNFLSVEGIGPWYEGDEYEELGKGEYRALVERYLEENEGGGKGMGRPSPYRGTWWAEFYRRVGEDAQRWEEIRGAMGRGKCRVVVRWREWVESGGEEEDVEMDMGDSSALFHGAGSGGHGRKKIKERLAGRHSRLTRSETRRRSQLGFSQSASASGVAIGIGGAGLGESLRSRALGNRELKKGRGGGGKK